MTAMSLIIANEGYAERFPVAQRFANYEIDNKKLLDNSLLPAGVRLKNQPDFADVPNKVLMVGNSHANDIFNALQQNQSGFKGYDFLPLFLQINCFDESIADYAARRESLYNARRYKNATAIIISTRYEESRKCSKKKDQQESSDLDGLQFLIDRVKADGKTIIVMSNTAEFLRIGGKTVVDLVYQLYKTSSQSFSAIKHQANQLLFKQLRQDKIQLSERVRIIAENNGAAFYDKVPIICDFQHQVCDSYTEEGFKTFSDSNHFTVEGAKLFGARLAADSTFRNLIER